LRLCVYALVERGHIDCIDLPLQKNLRCSLVYVSTLETELKHDLTVAQIRSPITITITKRPPEERNIPYRLDLEEGQEYPTDVFQSSSHAHDKGCSDAPKSHSEYPRIEQGMAWHTMLLQLAGTSHVKNESEIMKTHLAPAHFPSCPRVSWTVWLDLWMFRSITMLSVYANVLLSIETTDCRSTYY